jgi:hypothetical protein
MAPKGKQGTKGQKQIVDENASTLKFYVYIITAVNAVYLLLTYLVFWESFTTFYIVLFLAVNAIYFGSYQFLSSMARPTYSETGALLDGGIDLNMYEGMAEHMKDLILLTASTQSLTLLSNYFWFLLLLAPGRALYMLWVNILGPWFFAPPPEEDDKKAKKMERKMRRK